MNIAIQGQAGSFHDKARVKLFTHSEPLVCENFSDVFSAVISARAEYGIVAIENSLYGSINEVYSLLLDKKLWISGEVYLRVSFALIGQEGSTLEQITEVHSHPIAIAECSKFLDSYLPDAELINTSDTAKSVKMLTESGFVNQAAIAHADLAQEHNLKVLEDHIENDAKNYTRFIIIQRDKQQPANANKTSIILRLPERPGTLHEALGFFAERNINLTKLESHPVPGEVWEYIFYVDFEAPLAQAQDVIDSLKANGSEVTVLGSYTKANPLGED